MSSADGAELRVLRGHTDAVGQVAWSPVGGLVASASEDRTVRLWDTNGDDSEGRLHAHHDDAIWSVAWSPDGKRLATASSDRTARVWSADTGAQINGRRLATVSQDRTVRVWAATSGEELLVLGVHAGQAEGVAWSPDGRYIATSARDRTVRLWSAAVDLPAQLALARRFAFRELSGDERHSLDLPA